MATLNHAPGHRNAAAPAWHNTAFVSGQPAAAEAAETPLADRSPGLAHHPTLRIRPYSIADMPALVRFPGVLRLDVPDSLLLARPWMPELPAALPVLRKERPAFVAIADGQLVGFVRFSPRRPDGRWVISAIGASTGVYAPEPVWEALLAHGVRAAGLRGVRRLFARVPAGHPIVDTMHQSGWVSYSRETVFRAERLTARCAIGSRSAASGTRRHVGDSPVVRGIDATPGSGDRGAHESRLGHGSVPAWITSACGKRVGCSRRMASWLHMRGTRVDPELA